MMIIAHVGLLTLIIIEFLMIRHLRKDVDAMTISMGRETDALARLQKRVQKLEKKK